jgi:hypothetical protein
LDCALMKRRLGVEIDPGTQTHGKNQNDAPNPKYARSSRFVLGCRSPSDFVIPGCRVTHRCLPDGVLHQRDTDPRSSRSPIPEILSMRKQATRQASQERGTFGLPMSLVLKLKASNLGTLPVCQDSRQQCVEMRQKRRQLPESSSQTTQLAQHSECASA